jgi:hypothetical protein
MEMHGRKVLLLIDNAASHKVIREYRNVEVYFLPPNMTAAIQPLDQGIICSFKARYKRQLVQWFVDSLETSSTAVKISFFESITMSISSWKSIEEKIISNCWLKSRIVPASEKATLKAASDYKKIADLDLCDLRDNFKRMNLSISAEEYLEVDYLDESEIHLNPEAETVRDDADVSNENEENEEEDEQGLLTTSSEAIDSLLKLQNFLLRNFHQTEHERKLLNKIPGKLRILISEFKGAKKDYCLLYTP